MPNTQNHKIFFTTTTSRGLVVEFFLDDCDETPCFLEAIKPETIIEVFGSKKSLTSSS